MKICTLIDSNLFELKAAGNTSREISKIYCCDLLSIAMGNAPASCAWVTVMGNRNMVAVASLAEAACIILAEGAILGEEDISHAALEGITVFHTELPVFDAALKLHELMRL